MKLISKEILNAKHVVSKSKIRPPLTGVNITKKHYEATDSYVAIRIKRPSWEWESENFPKSNFKPLRKDNVLLDLSNLKKFNFKKSKQGCLVTWNDNKIFLDTNDLISTQEIKWDFPNLDPLFWIPTGQKVELWVWKLKQLLKAFDDDDNITFHLWEYKNSPVHIYTNNQDKHWIIMPVI